MKDKDIEFAVDEALRLFAEIIVQQERKKWIDICFEFGADDEGCTANKILMKGRK